MDGTYRANSGSLCGVKLHTTAQGGVITNIRLDYPGCDGEY